MCIVKDRFYGSFDFKYFLNKRGGGGGVDRWIINSAHMSKAGQFLNHILNGH